MITAVVIADTVPFDAEEGCPFVIADYGCRDGGVSMTLFQQIVSMSSTLFILDRIIAEQIICTISLSSGTKYDISYIHYHFLPRFSCMKLVMIFLLYNNLFTYQVLCTVIYRRRRLYSFLCVE